MEIHFNLSVSGGEGVHGNGQKSYQNLTKNKHFIFSYNFTFVLCRINFFNQWKNNAATISNKVCNAVVFVELLLFLVQSMIHLIDNDPSERPQTGEIYGFGLDSNRI